MDKQVNNYKPFISKSATIALRLRFYYCVEPGPIDNSDFLCQHGALNPDKELSLEYLFMEIPLEIYDYLHKRFGGCPPITEPIICPACTAVQQRKLHEMESFFEVIISIEIVTRTKFSVVSNRSTKLVVIKAPKLQSLYNLSILIEN